MCYERKKKERKGKKSAEPKQGEGNWEGDCAWKLRVVCLACSDGHARPMSQMKQKL